MKHLPHGPYIAVVCDALTEAGLGPAEVWTSDAESSGLYPYLSAAVSLDWPGGLVLFWEWHTGVEDGVPERGPTWYYANSIRRALPVHGYASPAAIVEATRKAIGHKIDGSFWDGGIIGDSWAHADALEAAVTLWGIYEVGA